MLNSSCLGGSGYGGGTRSSEGFPSPFLDMASMAMPQNFRNALDFCEYIFSANSTYRMGMERVIAYFLTEVDITSTHDKEVGEDERVKFKEYLNDQLGVNNITQSLLRDRLCYGNGFVSTVRPFFRMLVCKCGFRLSYDEACNNDAYKADFNGAKFKLKCPRKECNFQGEWTYDDNETTDESLFCVKRWSPKEMEIVSDPWTGESQYYWRMPQDYRKALLSGNKYLLGRAPREIIEAAKGNLLYRFNTGTMFHMKEASLAGHKTNGWGVSPALVSFRQLYYVQVLHRFNEAIALDYVTPFRLITPAAQPGSHGEPAKYFNLGDFSSQVNKMVRNRRRDPCGWNVLPFPVNYQALGGDATDLAPKDLIDQGQDTLLNGAGVPVELYRGSLTLQTAPVALRLFESTWHHLVYDMNRFVDWLADQVSNTFGWEAVKASYKPVKVVDDIQRMTALLQLMMGNMISQTTALAPFGIEPKHEQKLMVEEMQNTADLQSRAQEEQQRVDFGKQMAMGAPAQGGAAPAGGGQPMMDPAMQAAQQPVTSMYQGMDPNAPVTMDDLLASAEALATDLQGLPPAQRNSEMRTLKQKNEALHAIVTQKLRSQRQQASNAGQAMVMQQQFGTQ